MKRLSRLQSTLLALLAALLITACGTAPQLPPSSSLPPESPEITGKRQDITVFALGLIDTGYRFGGKNPEAGLDCSGMVSYVYRETTGMQLNGSAAEMAKRGREIDKLELRAGDLVFFNTLGRPFSHVGIYIGDGRFIHAPSSRGKVRIERMDNRYFAQRFEMARSYLY
jgi:cell wall-associated NlpC family hydrolase